MSTRFEELDWQRTPLGDVSLRRRREPSLHVEVYEVKLGDEFLMSSLFTVAETALATLGLAELSSTGLPGDELDVVVGGLGLGYTARAVLAEPRVRSLVVVEALAEVVAWHERGLIPLADALTGDPRCSLVQADFFARAAREQGFTPEAPERVHAVLLDVDHSPRHLLHPSHAGFYTPDGLRRLSDHLHPGGVFGMWADGQPDEDFRGLLEQVFARCEAHVVTFPNHYTGEESASTVYVARAAATGSG